MSFCITVKHFVQWNDGHQRGPRSWWVARIAGVLGEFRGRSRPEAVGRAFLHLVKWELPEMERREVSREPVQ